MSKENKNTSTYKDAKDGIQMLIDASKKMRILGDPLCDVILEIADESLNVLSEIVYNSEYNKAVAEKNEKAETLYADKIKDIKEVMNNG